MASKVQTLRGLACLCLVAYHVVGASKLQGMHIASGWLTIRLPYFCSMFFSRLQPAWLCRAQAGIPTPPYLLPLWLPASWGR